MTVQYSQLVLTGGPAVFFRLLLKWRGCVFKLIYVDIIVFLCLYVLLSCTYRFAMSEVSQRAFEQLVIFTSNSQTMIPIAFLLGFYIQLVFSRFWHTFLTVPWMIKISLVLAAHLPGTCERSRLMRRTCVRYLLASLILTSTRLHLTAKKRFPTLEHLVHAGALTEEEVKLISATQPVHIQPFVPIVWTTSLITLAEKEGILTNHHALALIIEEVNSFRQRLLDLFLLDHVSVPLVYTQVVTLSVYCYFAASIVGSQFIMESSPNASKRKFHDLYFPFFTLLEFIIYVGWLKVAETLVNPMGEDDEDLDINEIIDYNWKVAWCIVDGMKPSPPAVVRDAHWDRSLVELPHTVLSKRLNSRAYRGSMYDISIPVGTDFLGSLQSMSAIGRSQDFTGSNLFGRQSSVATSTKHIALPPHLSTVDSIGEESQVEEPLTSYHRTSSSSFDEESANQPSHTSSHPTHLPLAATGSRLRISLAGVGGPGTGSIDIKETIVEESEAEVADSLDDKNAPTSEGTERLRSDSEVEEGGTIATEKPSTGTASSSATPVRVIVHNTELDNHTSD